MFEFKNSISALKNYLSRHFSLEYLAREKEGNLCYAEAHEEMRPEFRLVFTQLDLEKYLEHIAAFVSQENNAHLFLLDENLNLYLPKTEEVFWQVASGD